MNKEINEIGVSGIHDRRDLKERMLDWKIERLTKWKNGCLLEVYSKYIEEGRLLLIWRESHNLAERLQEYISQDKVSSSGLCRFREPMKREVDEEWLVYRQPRQCQCFLRTQRESFSLCLRPGFTFPDHGFLDGKIIASVIRIIAHCWYIATTTLHPLVDIFPITISSNTRDFSSTRTSISIYVDMSLDRLNFLPFKQDKRIESKFKERVPLAECLVYHLSNKRSCKRNFSSKVFAHE